MIPDNVIDKKLYKKAKRIADKTYKRSGAYKSMFIVKKYKELGGRYKDKKTSNLSQWRNENWISLEDYLKGDIIPCGSDDIGKNVCRPLKRINSKTPPTVKEVIENLGKDKIKDIIKKKKNNMDSRINWKSGLVKTQ